MSARRADPVLGPLLAACRHRRGSAAASASSTLAAIAGVLLLGVAGGFLTGAARAGAGGVAAVGAFNYLLPSALIRLLAITRTVARYGERYLAHRAALLAMARLRSRLFALLARRDPRGPDHAPAGEAAARLAADVDALERLLVIAPGRAGALAAGAVALVAGAFAGWTVALALGVLMALLLVVARHLLGAQVPDAARRSRAALGEWRVRLLDLAQARAEIAAYGLASDAVAALIPAIARHEAAERQLDRARQRIEALVQGASALALILVLALGHGSAPMLALVALAVFAGCEGFGAITAECLQRLTAQPGGERLQPLVAVRHEGGSAPAAGGLRIGALRLPPGARVALTGISGSGKTTILETLAGLRGAAIDAALGDLAVADAPFAVLTRHFAISPQDAPVLIGSVADNLRLARPGVDAPAMWQALDVACLAGRVRRMPRGLDEPVGTGGLALSGGERKRLSLARALLAARPWLVLDEPSEGLDAATEQSLVAALAAWLAASGTGLILASHRPAPLALAEYAVAAETILLPRPSGVRPEPPR